MKNIYLPLIQEHSSVHNLPVILCGVNTKVVPFNGESTVSKREAELILKSQQYDKHLRIELENVDSLFQIAMRAALKVAIGDKGIPCSCQLF